MKSKKRPILEARVRVLEGELSEALDKIDDLNTEVDTYFNIEQSQLKQIEDLEAEANALFDENAATENDRDYWKAIAEQSGAVADAALDQRDELTAALEATENRLAHAQDAIASLLLSI